MTTPTSCPRLPLPPRSPAARYCHRCGRAVTSGVGERGPWIVAWALVLVALSGITWFVLTKDTGQRHPGHGQRRQRRRRADAGRRRQHPAGHQPDVAAGAIPPAARPDHDRRRAAATPRTAQRLRRWRSAPTACWTRSTPTPATTPAAIHVRLGDYAAALALADTIQAEAPRHLFGDLLAARGGPGPGATRPTPSAPARPSCGHYDAEIKAGRPEYREHQAMLDRATAEQARPLPVRRTVTTEPHAPHHPRRPQPRFRRRVHVLRARRGQDRHRRPALRARAVGHRVAQPARARRRARGDRRLDPRLRLPRRPLRPARQRLLDGRRLRPPAGGAEPPRPARPARAGAAGASGSPCPGKLTTAYLALRLYQPDFEAVVVPFDQIEDAVLAATWTSAC